MQHFVIIRNEGANAGVVLRELNAKMSRYAHGGRLKPNYVLKH